MDRGLRKVLAVVILVHCLYAGVLAYEFVFNRPRYPVGTARVEVEQREGKPNRVAASRSEIPDVGWQIPAREVRGTVLVYDHGLYHFYFYFDEKDRLEKIARGGS